MTAAAVSSTPAVLSLQRVTAGYGATTVLRDVSLEVAAGRVIALLGPNGAGKTTLMRLAAGLVRPTAGAVRHAGADVTSRSAAARARTGICLIPEGRGVFPSLTVRENVAVLVKPRQRSAALEQVAEIFPALRDRFNQVAGTMSGGQQQMLAMARCYLAPADVILLDEVSMGLAPLIVDEIYQSIGELARRGTALVVVEQYVDRVLAIADTVHVLSRGEITFSGPPSSTSRDELMQKYLHVTIPSNDARRPPPDLPSSPTVPALRNQEST